MCAFPYVKHVISINRYGLVLRNESANTGARTEQIALQCDIAYYCNKMIMRHSIVPNDLFQRLFNGFVPS